MMFNYRKLIRRKIAQSYAPIWLIRYRNALRYLGRILDKNPLASRSSLLSCRPLFIIGSGRSGTTLLRSMLVAGGEIAIPPESYVIHVAVRKYLSLQFLGWKDLSRLIVALFESSAEFHLWDINLYTAHRNVMNLPENERSLARIIDEIFRCYADQHFPRAIAWGDQSPVNTLHLPWIFRTFPKAKYLHLLRDGRDAISSMVARGRDVEYATKRWATSVRQVLALKDKLNDDQFLEVRYENLVSEPVGKLRRICKFAGLEYSEQMLEFWKLPTTIEHKHYEHQGAIRKRWQSHRFTRAWRGQRSGHHYRSQAIDEQPIDNVRAERPPHFRVTSACRCF